MSHRIVCDRCGNIAHHMLRAEVEITDNRLRTLNMPPQTHVPDRLDLCESCVLDLIVWLKR